MIQKPTYKIKGIFYNIAVFIFISIASIGTANSAETNLSIEPAISHLIIAPKNNIIKTFKLTNLGDPTILTLKVAQVSVKNNAGEIIIQDFSQNLKEIITITTTDPAFPLEKPFLIKSQEAFEFDVKIEVADFDKTEDIYLALIAETNTTDSFTDKSRVLIESAIGSTILLSVTKDPANLKEDVSLVLFEPKSYFQFELFGNNIHLVDSSSAVPISAVVANKSGNVSILGGNINIQNKFFKQNSTLLIQKQLVYAESTKEITNSRTSFLPKNLIGIYEVKLDLEKNTNTTDSVRVIVLATPIKIIKNSFVFITALAIGFILYKKYRRN